MGYIHQETKVIDPHEAPQGYFAVLKSNVNSKKLGNICRACDYRQYCDGLTRCMPYTLIRHDGSELKRNDGCSVVFKRQTKTK